MSHEVLLECDASSHRFHCLLRDYLLTEITPSQRLTLLLDESPLKPFQRWLWVLSTGGTLLDGFVIFALGVAMPLIIAEFHIRHGAVGLIGAALVLGAVVGAERRGTAADQLGTMRVVVHDRLVNI